MRIALRLTMLVIAVACAGLFLFHPWWFPSRASRDAAAVDRGLLAALWAMGGLFLLAQIGLFIILGRNRQQGSSRGNWKIELAWTAAISAIFFGFNLSGGRLWSRISSRTGSTEAVQVEITGIQFQWYFRYPGTDGSFGRINAVKFARPDEGNPLGIDPSDPSGRDDLVSPTLVLPVGREADLTLRAQDVIHSVFIPAMRVKQDAVPGMDVHTHFTPTQIGTYELVCTQLCGLGHYRMRSVVRIVSNEDFKQWLKSRSQPLAASPR